MKSRKILTLLLLLYSQIFINAYALACSFNDYETNSHLREYADKIVSKTSAHPFFRNLKLSRNQNIKLAYICLNANGSASKKMMEPMTKFATSLPGIFINTILINQETGFEHQECSSYKTSENYDNPDILFYDGRGQKSNFEFSSIRKSMEQNQEHVIKIGTNCVIYSSLKDGYISKVWGGIYTGTSKAVESCILSTVLASFGVSRDANLMFKSSKELNQETSVMSSIITDLYVKSGAMGNLRSGSTYCDVYKAIHNDYGKKSAE